MSLFKLIIKLIFLIHISYQNEVIGFYQSFDTSYLSYTWERCDQNCFTCVKGPEIGKKNCLSCDPKKGLYLLLDDVIQDCYKKDNLPDTNIDYILDTKQIPNKWVPCHENCKTCFNKPSLDDDQLTIIQMNCIECKDGFIQVNTFCFPKITGDGNLGFYDLDNQVKHCGNFYDDETRQQLGILEGSNKCIIKPESYYFPQNHETKKLRRCGEKCLACEGVAGDDDDSNCLNLLNLYLYYIKIILYK